MNSCKNPARFSGFELNDKGKAHVAKIHEFLDEYLKLAHEEFIVDEIDIGLKAEEYENVDPLQNASDDAMFAIKRPGLDPENNPAHKKILENEFTREGMYEENNKLLATGYSVLNSGSSFSTSASKALAKIVDVKYENQTERMKNEYLMKQDLDENSDFIANDGSVLMTVEDIDPNEFEQNNMSAKSRVVAEPHEMKRPKLENDINQQIFSSSSKGFAAKKNLAEQAKSVNDIYDIKKADTRDKLKFNKKWFAHDLEQQEWHNQKMATGSKMQTRQFDLVKRERMCEELAKRERLRHVDKMHILTSNMEVAQDLETQGKHISNLGVLKDFSKDSTSIGKNSAPARGRGGRGRGGRGRGMRGGWYDKFKTY